MCCCPSPGLQIVGEYFLPIHFDLLGIPGSTIEAATEVHSHIHALGQCRRLIRDAGLRPVIAGDTAGSAREVRDWNDPTKLSLAPPLAAQIYGLEVLASARRGRPVQHHPLCGPGPGKAHCRPGTICPDRQ